MNTNLLKKLALFGQELSHQLEGLVNSLKFFSLCINGCLVAKLSKKIIIEGKKKAKTNQQNLSRLWDH